MKKFLLWFFGAIIVLLILAYVLIFTQLGNNFVKPFVSSKINQYSPIKLEVEKFSLRPNYIEIMFRSENLLTFDLKANFSIFSQQIIGEGIGKIKTQEKSYKIFSQIKGKFLDFNILFKSDIATSATQGRINIKKFQPSLLQIKTTDLKLDELFNMLGRKSYAKGNLNIHADIKIQNKSDMNGIMVMNVKNGVLNSNSISKDFQESNFAFDLQTNFKGNLVQNNLFAVADFGNMTLKGMLNLSDLNLDDTYHIKLSDASILSPLFKIPVRGNADFNGSITGTLQEMILKGKTNIANSNTSYEIHSRDFRIDKIIFQAPKISLNKILWMFYQPKYVDSTGSFRGSLTDVPNEGFKFQVNARFNGDTAPDIKKLIKVDMPKTFFDTQINFNASKTQGRFSLDLDTPIGDIDILNGVLDFSNLSFNGDYKASFTDLSRLIFITQTPLNGSLKLKGDFNYQKTFNMNFLTKSLGGDLKAQLQDDQFRADFSNIPLKNILSLFNISEVIEATSDGDLNYDIKTQKGQLSASFINARFMPNELTYIFKRYAKYDATKQPFDSASFTSDIHGKTLDANLKIGAGDLKIDSEYMKINLDKNAIDSRIKLGLKNDYIYANLNGKINSPKITINASDLLGNKTIQNVNTAIDKYVPKDTQKKAKQLFRDLINKK